MKPSSGSKRVALPILFAFTVLPLLLQMVASMSERPSPPASGPIPWGILYAIDALILVVAAGYATIGLRPGLPPQKFFQTMVISLAISEFASILTFMFLFSSGSSVIAPAVAGSILVNLFFIAPRVLAFSRT